MIYVGIDTGVNTGFAVWDSKQRSLLQVCSLPIHKAMERVRSLYDEYKAGIGDKVIVRVEDPRQRTWFGTERMSREMERKKLQGVGSVKRDASIWDDYLKELGELAEINEPVRETYYKGNERIDEVAPKYALLSTHAGRRTFICNALALGIPAQVVMKWTGHSDYKAMKPYIDIADDIKANAMNKFNQL